MKTVTPYILDKEHLSARFVLEMPAGSVALRVTGTQYLKGYYVLHCETPDVEARTQTYSFGAFPDNTMMPDDCAMRYVDTFIFDEGLWHLYEYV